MSGLASNLCIIGMIYVIGVVMYVIKIHAQRLQEERERRAEIRRRESAL